MATAISMITRAMRLSRAIGVGETPTDDEAADGLVALNSMLESFSIERLNVYYIVEETLTMVASQQTYTMGSGGDLNTTRPTRIEDACFIRYATIDTPLMLVNFEAWAAIPSKTVSSNIPNLLFVDMQNPLVRLNFYPMPTSASAVAHIFSWKQLQQFSALTDVLALPPGYERLITYNLSTEWASPEFGQPVSPDVMRIAVQSKANIKRINAPAPVMRTELGYMTRQWPAYNIYTG